MTTQHLTIDTIGIVGTGAMGRGIAQIATLAGLTVRLYDANPAAVSAACDHLGDIFTTLVAKGKLEQSHAQAASEKVVSASELSDLAGCDLVIEAIVENLEIKQQLFRDLETVVGDQCILASNTSSLSITAIAAGCAVPSRVAGFHFFNPVPLMKVVEVVDGLRTDPAVGDALMVLARRIGHTPVRANDMPGFIVNHAGRGLNTEGLRIVGEGVADFVDVDRIMREQAGFRLGPFELLDLTALDVSHPVMESIYHQFYEEPRFTPSPITRTRLAGGLIGRKTGEGFYRYVDGKQQIPEELPAPALLPRRVWISNRYPAARKELVEIARMAGVSIDDDVSPADDSLLIVTPFGHDATSAAIDENLDASRVVACDALFPLANARRRTLMVTPATTRASRDAAHALFAHGGVRVTVLRDSTGFVAQRVVATIVNIGCDIAQKRIASPQDIDLAVTLGLGYPRGPLTLGDSLGASTILEILRNMYAVLGDPRYRPSPWLTRRARLGMSLTQIERADAVDETALTAGAE